MIPIYFHEINIRSGLLNKRAFKIFLDGLFSKEKKKLTRVDIIFCSNRYLRTMNKKYLGHDYNTDTISFLLSDTEQPIQGELYISIDQVSLNAKLLDIPFQIELSRVLIHSCLHLCGYLDKPEKASKKMTQVQELYLKGWLVSRETRRKK